MAGSLTATKPDIGVQTASRHGHVTLLAVPDMHCGGCMRKVETALSAMPGVASARANLSARRVALVTDKRPGNAEPYIDVLRSAGFAATVLADPADTTHKSDDGDLLRRLGVAGFAAANIMLLSVSVWSGHAADMPASMQTLFHWLSALIALPAVAYAGQPFFSSARKALAMGRLNMDVPISLGVTLATGMSLFQTLRGTEHVYFDAAITLLFFLLIGRVLDQRMRVRAAGAAENLLGLRSPAASVIGRDGTVERVATAMITPGARVRVAAGERIPVDGRIVAGGGMIDQSLITGESAPRTAGVGELVYCGTINLAGPLEIEATAAADDTLLADIARLMATAEQARGRYVRLADRAARLYAPAVHILGAVTFLGWMLMGHGWEAALTAAIAVLIITCPCALALAVPAVQVVATSRLFRQGVVVKSPDALERLSEVDTIVLDKTGTLTRGEPRLVDPATIGDADLAMAAALAGHSRHPYSVAVVTAARHRRLQLPPVDDVREAAGQGVAGRIDGVDLRLGSADYCDVAPTARAGNDSSLWLRREGQPPLALRMRDELRPDAGGVVAALRTKGYDVEILSGDRSGAVEEAAAAVGIARWRAELSPAGKFERLDALKGEGRRILMVGDGLNDAPALAAGHASMSPANAADISQTASDAVFQGERLAPILEVLDVAKAAQRRALENFAIAIGYNVVFVPMAMLGQVTPLIAAIAMSASSIAVTANALRLSGRGQEIRS